jgi:ketosteroid isomerase-like protein
MTSIDGFLSAWCDAERDADVKVLDSLLREDFVGVGPLGFTLDKPAWLARHRGGDLTYDTFELDERQIRVHGDTAVATVRQLARGTYQGHPTPDPIRATLTLIKESGQWRLAGIHMSFIAGTPGAPPIPGKAV